MARNMSVQCVFSLLILSYTLAENYDYLKKCDKNDPNINECMLHNANLALPHILKGNEKIGFPSFLPLKFPKYKYGLNEKYTVTTTDTVIYGFEGFKIAYITWDMEETRIMLQIFFPKLYSFGYYTAEGNFMDHKLSGKGIMTQIFDEIHTQFDVHYEVNEDGYATVTNAECDNQYKNITIHFQDLHNGEQTNTLINKNWKTFYEIFEPTKRKFFARLAVLYFNSVFQSNTIDSLFTSKPVIDMRNEL